MLGKNLIVALGLAGGLVAVTGADIVSTRVFSNIQGGEPLTLITTITGSATAIVPLSAVASLSTISGNDGPDSVVAQDSATLPPGVYLTTIPANHAPPEVYTRTSSVPMIAIVTTTNTVFSTVTVIEPTNTVTVQVSKVSAQPSPSLVIGLCYWGQGGIEVPCTYTAGSLPKNVDPNAAYASNNLTTVNGSTVVTSTASSAAMSTRGNPFKFLLASVKNLAAREALDARPVDWSKVNMTGLNNASEPEFDKYRGEVGVKWAICDHVPIVYGPMIMAVMFVAHSLLVRWKWNKPSKKHSNNSRQVITFMVVWGISFPLFVYLEIYTSVAAAWKDCVPDPNRTYAY